VITVLIDNAVNWTYLVALVLMAALTGAVMSAASLLIEEIGFHRYRARDLARLTAWGLVEAFWFVPPGPGGASRQQCSRSSAAGPAGLDSRGEGILELPPHKVHPLTR
jgi:hypothetical protein